MLSEKLKISDSSRILQRGNRVIIVNTSNGEWHKLSEECYKIILSAIEKEISREELILCFKDDSDKDYFNKLLDKLISIGVIYSNCNDYNRIYQISFNITHRCNLSCIHCSVNASTILEHEKFTFDQVKIIADKIISCDPKSIVITGGEPLVRNDFFDIMNYIKNNFTGKLSIMTNGLLINEKNIEKLISYFSAFNISIDGVDELTCSKIRGIGTFEKVIYSVNLLKKYGIKNISLSMIISEYSLTLIEKFNALNKELGTKPVLRFFAPVGRGEVNKKSIIQELSNDKRDYGENLASPKIDIRELRGYSCGAVKNEIQIGIDGNVYPCAAFQKYGFELGNILEIDDLKKFLKEKAYLDTKGYKNFSSTIPFNNPKCKECDVNLFCITCPFYSYMHEMEEDFEEYCKFKKVKYSSIWEEL